MENHRADTLIIGGGVIGLCIAYYAAETAGTVALIEKDRIPAGSSYGNAGLLVPSHCFPLADPSMMREGIRQLFHPAGAFAIRLRAEPELFSWLWRFFRSCRKDRFFHAVRVLKQLGEEGIFLHHELAEKAQGRYRYRRSGMLMLYKKPDGLRKDARQLKELGAESHVLSAQETRELEPSIQAKLAGGIFHPSDGMLQPASFLSWLEGEAGKKGVSIHTETEAFDFKISGRRIESVYTTKGAFRTGRVVIAAGAWSPKLSRRLGLRLPIQPGKGYSLTFAGRPEAPRHPLILAEPFIAVTPFEDMLRITGVFELSGLDRAIDPQRVRRIHRHAGAYIPGLSERKPVEIWRGFRPCTPDDIPIVGKCAPFENLWVASGHATRGISLGPWTGKRVSEMLMGKALPLEKELSPERFSGTTF
ncbi:MAG: FAD-dependent oxidoreductase [Desulfobacteraceae bacterium]|nr:MAG: FAD-dependent oxidoreductase [Desulfobacteraceae bacterium]